MKTSTADRTFRIRIVGAKRQATIPVEMMEALLLESGDEIEFTVRGHMIVSAVPKGTVRLDLFPPEIVEFLRKSQQEVGQGAFREITLDDFRAELTKRCGQNLTTTIQEAASPKIAESS
jgi:bifunctional DNA-binding transcriptional regulator/antitoxin component of YhaV-PrlF toxin-antitoxin module